MLSVLYDDLFIRVIPKNSICIFKSPSLNNIGLNDSSTGEIIWLNNNNYEKIPPIILKFLEARKLLKIIKTPILESIGLYKVTNLENGIRLENKISELIEQTDIETVEKEFVKLDKFIKNALYIGRYFISENPEAPKYILLYEFKSVYLLKSIENDMYLFVDKYFASLKGYEIKNIHSEYYEKEAVLEAIIEQEMPNKKEGRSL